MSSRPRDESWLRRNMLPVMVVEDTPYGPQDEEDEDDREPQGVIDALLELDEAVEQRYDSTPAAAAIERRDPRSGTTPGT